MYINVCKFEQGSLHWWVGYTSRLSPDLSSDSRFLLFYILRGFEVLAIEVSAVVNHIVVIIC
jgi:hypothetical protein